MHGRGRVWRRRVSRQARQQQEAAARGRQGPGRRGTRRAVKHPLLAHPHPTPTLLSSGGDPEPYPFPLVYPTTVLPPSPPPPPHPPPPPTPTHPPPPPTAPPFLNRRGPRGGDRGGGRPARPPAPRLLLHDRQDRTRGGGGGGGGGGTQPGRVGGREGGHRGAGPWCVVAPHVPSMAAAPQRSPRHPLDPLSLHTCMLPSSPPSRSHILPPAGVSSLPQSYAPSLPSLPSLPPAVMSGVPARLNLFNGTICRRARRRFRRGDGPGMEILVRGDATLVDT